MLCGGLSPLCFGSTPYSETLTDLLDLHCFPHKQSSFSFYSLPRRKTLIYAAKLHNWALAEPFFIELFIFHDISIIYMVDCVKSGGRVSC